jgi:hypothetical protein
MFTFVSVTANLVSVHGCARKSLVPAGAYRSEFLLTNVRVTGDRDAGNGAARRLRNDCRFHAGNGRVVCECRA